MSTCAEVLAATLRDAGVERMFGLPGGEILDFIDAARQVGIEFILVRHEAVAAFMADAAGQIARRPFDARGSMRPRRVSDRCTWRCRATSRGSRNARRKIPRSSRLRPTRLRPRGAMELRAWPTLSAKHVVPF